MLKNILLLTLLLAPPASHANNSFSTSKVTKIILHDWGRVLIYLEGSVLTNEDCPNKSAITLSRDNQHFTEMYSALLAAYHSGSQVSGWVNKCDTSHNNPILTRLDLMPKDV